MAKKMVSFCDRCEKTVVDPKDLTPAKIGKDKKMELCASCVEFCTQVAQPVEKSAGCDNNPE